MNIFFEKMDIRHATGVMKIFNYYADKTTAAFLPKAIPDHFFVSFLKRSEGYPAYVLIDKDNSQVVGFAQLSAYNAIPTFQKTAKYTCFISPEYTGKGLGSMAFDKVEADAKASGLDNIISDISSDNGSSIRFHEKHGFKIVGKLSNIGEKFGRKFSIVLMQKNL